jgi:RNA-directed DNA polymerase
MTLVSWREVEFALGMDRRSLLNLGSKALYSYKPFDILKRNGAGRRHIDNPEGLLKIVQQRIYQKFLRNIQVPDNMIGGVAGRSVKKNALVHVGQPTLVKLDLRNHFGRIDNSQVFEALRRELGASPTIARVFTQLTTVQSRLPQGASTSSMLANLVLLPAHREISGIAARAGLNYTLFVDDLTLSGPGARRIIQPVISILQSHGFAVVRSKLQILDSHERQETTGLVVNRKVALSRSHREQIRADVLRFAYLGNVSSREFSSLWGRIRYAAFIDPHHGAALAELAEERLPPTITDEVVRVDECRFVCSDPSLHRYRPPARVRDQAEH